MKKQEFLRRLSAALSALPDEERARSMDYYAEIIDERMEDDYTIDCSADNGSCSLPERQTGGTRTLRAHADNGSIRLSFTE